MFVYVDWTEGEKGKGKTTIVCHIIKAGSNYLGRTSAYLASEGKWKLFFFVQFIVIK